MNAVKKLHTLGMGAVVATAALGLFALTANAQQPPAAAPAAPTVAPVKPATPPAPPAAAKAPVTAPAATTPAAGAATPKPVKKVASACKGLDETACKANAECGYVVPTKADAKTGKVDKAYCRKVAGVAAKPKAAAPAATTAPAAAAKPAAPAAAAAPKAATVPAPAAKQ